MFILQGAFPIKKSVVLDLTARFPDNPMSFVKKLMGELYSKEFFELHKKTWAKATNGKETNKIPMSSQELKEITGK